MNLVVLQENLNRAMGALTRVANPKSPLPIAATVLLETNNGRLVMRATNLDQSLTVTVGAMVAEEGAVAVDARRFAEAIGNLPAVSLSLTLAGTQLVVEGGNANLRFPTMDATDFPRGVDAEWGEAVEIPAVELRTVARSVGAAAAVDDSRPALTGIELQIVDGRRTWAAADGFRLHVYGQASGERGVIIPARALRMLSDMHGGGDPVSIQFTGDRSRMRATWGDHDFSTLAIQGTFPNYAQLIPSEARATWEVDAQALLHAVRIARGFADGIVRFRGAEGRIRVTGHGDDAGEGEATVEAAMRGEAGEQRFALNTRYAADALGAFTGVVTVESNGPSQQVVFRSESLTCVVMPMFVQER